MSESFTITFRRDVLAEALWEYGEDAHAETALWLDDDDLRAVQRLAVWHHEHDPDPPDGPRLTHARVIARAMIDWAEGGGRDTARVRRRTRPPEERYTAAFETAVRQGETPPSTPAEDGHA